MRAEAQHQSDGVYCPPPAGPGTTRPDTQSTRSFGSLKVGTITAAISQCRSLGVARGQPVAVEPKRDPALAAPHSGLDPSSSRRSPIRSQFSASARN